MTTGNLTPNSTPGTLIFTTDIDGNLANTGEYLGGVKKGQDAYKRWTLNFWCRINGEARWMSFPKTYTNATDLPATRHEIATRALRYAKRDLADLIEDRAAGEAWATDEIIAAAKADVEKYTRQLAQDMHPSSD